MSKKVKGCFTCPFKEGHYGQDGRWDYCCAPGSPEGYDNILEHHEQTRNLITPAWCPLPITIERG